MSEFKSRCAELIVRIVDVRVECLDAFAIARTQLSEKQTQEGDEPDQQLHSVCGLAVELLEGYRRAEFRRLYDLCVSELIEIDSIDIDAELKTVWRAFTDYLQEVKSLALSGETSRPDAGEKHISLCKAIAEFEPHRRMIEKKVQSSDPKGVSLRDIAAIRCDNDPDCIRSTKRRWSNSRSRTLPEPIGFDSDDRRAHLYALSAILQFVKDLEGLRDDDISSLRRQLSPRLRIPRLS